MKLLSIVVPVYNVEKYVEHCIASILSQSFNDFELILVDDGSTDSSGKICDDFALRDDRVKVFHKENGGLMSAWKYGVERSNGKYIGFVDSDDWIDLDMYEVLIGKAESTNADLVCSAFITETNDGERSEEQVYLSEGFYNRQSIQEKIYPIMITSKTLRKRVISSNRVTKLFKREILNKVLEDCDERISIGEDFVTTFAYMQNVDSVYVLDKFKPYHYRIHSSSMIRKHNNDKYEKILMLRDVLLNINNKYKRYDFSKQIHTDY